jgi:hypothetical protein
MGMAYHHRTLVSARGSAWCGTRRINSIATARLSPDHAKLLCLGMGGFTGRRDVAVASGVSRGGLLPMMVMMMTLNQRTTSLLVL